MSETPVRIRRGLVRLGEENQYLYRELLGYTAQEYAILEEEGHIGMDYHPDVRQGLGQPWPGLRIRPPHMSF